MKAAEYTLPLPPNVYRKIGQQDAAADETEVPTAGAEDSSPLAFLEIEVSRINFITDKSIKAQTSGAASIYKNLTRKPNKSKVKHLGASTSTSASPTLNGCKRLHSLGGITAKIIWWGEQRETAGSVSISCACSNPNGLNGPNEGKHKSHKQRSSQQRRQRSSQRQEHQHQHHPQHTNKLRYSVRSSSLALFLDYLKLSYIEIFTSGVCSNRDVNDHANPGALSDVPLGQTRLPLPTPLLRKYAANYVNGCNFEYKTKIYALYRHVESCAAFGQVQQQQQLKVGEIQLRFKMLFAANANLAKTKATESPSPPPPPPIQLPAALLQDQLTKAANGAFHSSPAVKHQQQSQPVEQNAGNSTSVNYNNNNANNNNHTKANANSIQIKETNGNVRSAGKSSEIMEAMKKLDADLAALFASAEQDRELEELKKRQQLPSQFWPEQKLNSAAAECESSAGIFERVSVLQLHLEALTLQPEGTQRMELIQSEVRPIFTVECQLSHELIAAVPRYDMFSIMQFESEKFQSLTQCTRFGQVDQRQVQLPTASEAMGRIDFAVWWREPGTCLNEMLGMGQLELAELYNASLLEQCRCIAIQRRGVHLASLYLKISLRADVAGIEQLTKSVPNGNAAENQPTNSGNCGNNNRGGGSTATPNGRLAPAKSNNNSSSNSLVGTINFMAEIGKVRLLRGYIYISETRQLSPNDVLACAELKLQPFWQTELLLAQANGVGAFNLQEQFAIINDDKFLQSVERQQLQLELCPLGGIVRLPLHQFYIAYRDASITNHLCKGKLPVISFDGWAPIFEANTHAQLGELRCLLAIGSETQIGQLKQLRGLDVASPVNSPLDKSSPQHRTSDLLNMLQSALSAPAAPSPVAVSQPASAAIAQKTDSHFEFMLHIIGATGLPLNPGYGKTSKKQAKRQTAAKRFTPNEPPNTYVTFQALSCNTPTYKSHEGLVYATGIMERSTTPQWRSAFQVSVDSEYLTNPQKMFILKLWKKASLNAGARNEPTPLEDAIIGFAALNLNQQSSANYASSWHNIVDFNGRITGGLEVQVKSLPSPEASQSSNMDSVIDQFEQSLELTHLHLGQAIKRKFTELEQISQRLRTRLVDVTGECLEPQFNVTAALDAWQSVDNNDDDVVDEFERALRTPTPPPSPLMAVNEAPTAQQPSQAETFDTTNK